MFLRQFPKANFLVSVHCTCQHRPCRTDLKVALEYPTVLVKELETIVLKPLHMYDEVNVLVNSLTNECNEFRQYCIKKGVSKHALPIADDAHPMEDVIR